MAADATVVGGGPAGLAAAIALAQLGAGVLLRDHAIPPIDKACGEGLMPDTLSALRRLGVDVPLVAGHPFYGVRFFDERSSVAGQFRSGPGVGLRRTALHTLLRRRALALGVDCRWGDRSDVIEGLLIGADGMNSTVRQKAGLDSTTYERRRFGFRKHFRVAPWSKYVEVFWGNGYQIYVTPVAPDEVGVAVLTRDPALRVDAALSRCPELNARLRGAEVVSSERGCPTFSRKLRSVCSDGVALVGDASGSVDAITGEGIGVAVRQALSLAQAVRKGQTVVYGREHGRLFRRQRMMARLLLLLDDVTAVRRLSIRTLQWQPGVFEGLLAFHVDS